MTHPKIWFLRHGQTEWNAQSRLQGQRDSPLTVAGIADAHRQAKIMEPILHENPVLVASPLGRVRQTADIVLRGRAYRTDARLMEFDAGAWQGLLRDDIMAAHPHMAPLSPLEIYGAAEGGEGMARFEARISAFLSELDAPTVIVAHGLLGQVLRAQVCGLSLTRAGRLSNRQGCVYVLENGQETVLEAP